jgi:hypothetical protein
MSKVCSNCGDTKEEVEFYKHSANPSGLEYRCKVCTNTKNSLYQKTKSGKLSRRKSGIMNRFGLTLIAYDKLLKDQGGTCAICKGPETVLLKSGMLKHLAVDHCHKTGQVRGLLCHHCNVAIGSLKDSVELLKVTIMYLEKHEGDKL